MITDIWNNELIRSIIFTTGAVVWVVLVMVGFAISIFLMLYLIGKGWWKYRTNYGALFQVLDAYRLWKRYGKNNDYTLTKYDPGWYLSYVVVRIQDKKYRHKQFKWYRNYYAKILKGIRKYHYRNGPVKTKR